MDFVGYAEQCGALVNAPLDGLPALTAHLAERSEETTRPPTERDLVALRGFVTRIRPAFEAGSAGDVATVVSTINALLVRHPITPFISDHNPDDLHIHVATQAASVAEQVISESLLGLATLVCDLGPTRLGVCADAKCTLVFVDTSPNQSRRYCSERCSSRANVAAYRARRRAEAG